MAEKRYYWLKLKEGFFDKKEVKKLRRIAGGDTYTIIYMKLLLLSLHDEGKLYFDGIEETFEEELALTLDEDVENVKVTISYLISVGLLELVTPTEAVLSEVHDLTGSEAWSTERSRKSRERKKALQCNTSATQVQQIEAVCNEDIDIEIETEIETDTDKSKSNKPKPKQIREEFEKLWRLYPKKQGHKKALEYYQRARENGTTYEQVEEGVKAYAEYVKATKQEDKYIKHGSTFFSQESWLDEWSVPQQNKTRYQPQEEEPPMTDEEWEAIIAQQEEMLKR